MKLTIYDVPTSITLFFSHQHCFYNSNRVGIKNKNKNTMNRRTCLTHTVVVGRVVQNTDLGIDLENPFALAMIVVIDFEEEVANQWGEEWLWFGRRRERDRGG